MAEPSFPLSGGCNCGAVRFEVTEPFTAARYCHCERCQRRTGSAFSISALTAPGAFRFLAGEEVARLWDPGDGGWGKAFCPLCGSHLFTRDIADPGKVSVRFGALDSEPGIEPDAHQFTAYAPSWAPVPDDGLPRFEERAPAGAWPPAEA